MIFLILAILSSALVSIIMRLSEKHVRCTMAMFLANYGVCALVGRYFMGSAPLLPSGSGGIFALVLGILGGVIFLVSLALYRINIQKNGVVLSALFMKLGVLVPMVMAMVFFREVPGLGQILGSLLAIGAIFVINLESGKTAIGSGLLLILLLLTGGLADSFTNIYEELGDPVWKDHFLFYIFLFAGIISLVTALIQRQKPRAADFLFGALVGLPNYFSSRFLLLSLGSLPAVMAYPIYNVATIVIISLAGVIFFRERLSRRKCVGFGMILLALVLLNL